MTELELPALDGTNPLGFLAALGVLDVLHRAGRPATLRWADDVVPTAVVTGATDTDDLVAVLDADRARWQGSIALRGPDGFPLDDAKPRQDVMKRWAVEVVRTLDRSRADADLFAALVSEGAVDGNDNAKPTHLHFTAGQQRFLAMARELAERVDADRLTEAVCGPWREDSPLPSLSWSSAGERLYALRGVNPSKDKRLGVPGADWLALLGLVFFPTHAIRARDGGLTLHTSGCAAAWKRGGGLRWPLWCAALDRDTVWSLVGTEELVAHHDRPQAATLREWSVLRVMQAPIRRTDQGGYGSFGAATVVAEGRPQ